MCKIDGCDAKPLARELCAKHYMRWRRTGDATKVRPPGAPRKGGFNAYARELFPSYSKRTLARYIAATKTLNATGGPDAVKDAVLKASRPNGSLNIAAYERWADSALLKDLRGNT
jgi:hypothetical protein